MSSKKRPRAGFTLIELLVVVAIIALLITILLPSLKEAREQGKRALCLSNLRSIAQGTAAYATEDRQRSEEEDPEKPSLHGPSPMTAMICGQAPTQMHPNRFVLSKKKSTACC